MDIAQKIVESCSWQDELKRTKDGALRSTIGNAAKILRNAFGKFEYNEFSNSIEYNGEELSENETKVIRELLEDEFELIADSRLVYEAAGMVSHESKRHPVREYLSQIRWDGVPRIDSWLTDYCSVEANDYTKLVGSRWLISSVARVFNPGCQVDSCLVFEGAQGVGKSSALRALGGEWFTDQLSDFSTKDAKQELQGVWIVELAELKQITGQGAEKVKAFLSSRVDRFRVPYGKITQKFPRQCVFAGTVNTREYLVDGTGNRRFWPVLVTDKIDVDGITNCRDQLFAEALFRFRQGERYHLEGNEIALAENETKQRMITDVWLSKIQTFVEQNVETLPDKSVGITPDKIMIDCLGIPLNKWNKADQARVTECMRAIGYVKARVRFSCFKSVYYIKQDIK